MKAGCPGCVPAGVQAAGARSPSRRPVGQEGGPRWCGGRWTEKAPRSRMWGRAQEEKARENESSAALLPAQGRPESRQRFPNLPPTPGPVHRDTHLLPLISVCRN